MKRSIKSLIFLPVLALLASSVMAQNPAVEDAAMQALRARLTTSLVEASRNQIQILSLQPTAMADMVQVELNTGEILYTNKTGEFLFAGDMFQSGPNGLTNLSSQVRQVRVAEKIAAVPQEEMIIFKPRETRATITVFTDVDCQYCRALHRDMDKLLDLGIEVHYLAYPRGGQQATSYNKMISVWCSDDRQKSLTQAKHGQNLPERDCENPVLEHYALGNQIGISGTPALVLADGRVIPGYMDSDRLAALLLDQ
ncbi:MAG: DsbC family protein [Gammaproteobacteria bacterium]|nr:DsbC family protein [Pseudomonadales bacterium]MCP5346568.1 DsbC family protein [Pseudomonadales bacterium]